MVLAIERKRKLRLSHDQVEIFNGDEEKFNIILKLGEKWGLQDEQGQIDNNINVNGQIELL